MKRHAAFLITLITLLTLSLAASVAGATCVTCSPPPPTPDAHCVYVSSGHGACTEPYYPDDYCRLACPNCPTEPCNPGGGGGGDCFMAGTTLGKGAPGQVVTTLGVLFESTSALNTSIFGAQTSRVLPAAILGEFTVGSIDQAIASVSPKATGRLQLAYAFGNDDNAGIGVSFVSKQEERVAFAGVSTGMGSRVQVYARDASRFEKQVSDAAVGNDDIQLIALSLNGRSYILALRSMSTDFTAGDPAPRLEKIKRAFEASVTAFPRPAAEPMVFRIPAC
jgi:hypothetical protein